MKISVTFRNGEGENWQKVYAEERIQKLNKYLDAPAEAHISFPWKNLEMLQKLI